MIDASLSGTYDGWLSLRGMIWQGKANLVVDGFTPKALTSSALTAAAEQFHAPVSLLEPYRAEVEAEVADRLATNDYIVRYYTFNVRMEREKWLLLAEWETLQTRTYVFNNSYGWYVTGGVRFGKVLYHITYSELVSKLDPVVYRDANATQADGVAHFIATQIDTGAAAAIGFNTHTVTTGVRIETSRNSALKFEVIGFEERANLPTEKAGIGKNILVRGALNIVF